MYLLVLGIYLLISDIIRNGINTPLSTFYTSHMSMKSNIRHITKAGVSLPSKMNENRAKQPKMWLKESDVHESAMYFSWLADLKKEAR